MLPNWRCSIRRQTQTEPMARAGRVQKASLRTADRGRELANSMLTQPPSAFRLGMLRVLRRRGLAMGLITVAAGAVLLASTRGDAV
jgi:hypothetical protein